jgi:hypothetical protein
MRLWRVVLLLVLTLVLPLRGALAVSMGMAVDAPPSAAHSAAPAKADAPCPHHAPAADHTQAAAPQHGDAGHSAHTHLLCDVCNVLALSVPIVAAERADTRPTHAVQGSERFSSVVLPIGHKPPIPV